MSNSYDEKRTWEIDTAANIDGNYLVDGFVWHPSAKNDDLLIVDANGDEIWTIRAAAGAGNHEAYGIEQILFPVPRQFKGIYISTIDGGTLYVKLNHKSPLAYA